MSSLKPYEIALQAGQVVAYALRPFVERHSPVADDPQSWLEKIALSDLKRLGRRDAEYLLSDPRVLLKTVIFYPEQFGDLFTASDIEWGTESLRILNLAARGTSLAHATMTRGVESMQLLLESIGAVQASQRLEAVSEGAYRDFETAVSGLPLELEAPLEAERPEDAAAAGQPAAQPVAPTAISFDSYLQQTAHDSTDQEPSIPAATTSHPAEAPADEQPGADGTAPPASPPVDLVLEDIEIPVGCRAADFRNGRVGVRVVYREALNFALVHNQVSPIVSVHAIHDDMTAPHTLDGAVVVMDDHSGIGAEPLRIQALQLPPVPETRDITARSHPTSSLAWPISPRQFAQIDEATTTVLRINVTIDGERQTQSHSIQLLARNEWYARSIPEILAAFVTPNSAGLSAPLKRAGELLAQQTGSSALDGYQQGPERAAEIARAVYGALSELEITYISPPASFEETGQKIRRVEEILDDRLGTCLDLSVLYAAALEQAGLNPVIVRVPGHAFAGFLTEDDQLAELALSDPGSIDNVVRTGRLVPVETTGLAGIPPTPFDQAQKSTEHWFDEGIHHILDISAAHRRVKPLPRFMTSQGSDVVEMFSERPAATPLPSVESPVMPAGGRSYRESDEKLLPLRVRKWRQSLLDLSLRNPLLSLRRTALELIMPERSLADFEDALSGGRKLLLRAEDDLAELGEAAGRTSARELGDDALDHILLREQTVYARLPGGSYGTRLDKLRREAKSAIEETGANRLFVTLGAMSWTTPTGKTALAPLFLLPASLEGSKKHRFHLSVEDGALAQPNWALIEKLRFEFQLSVPVLEEPPEDDNGIDVPLVLHEVRSELARQKLPFHVKPDVRLALLKFSTVDMWRDLGAHWQQFQKNPVIDHLVNEPSESFHDPVEADPVTDELEADAALPVPVDGSQLEAITMASAGKTFVLEGPPGTGKSQTITNMIADSLSHGKTVLFVAEKQAALEVVKTRLERVGLGPLTLQMHGSKQSVGDVRRQLLESWDAEATGNAASFEAQRDDHRRLITSLASYPKQLHDRGHAPLSVWEAHQNHIGLQSRLKAGGQQLPGLEIPARLVRDPELARAATLTAERLERSLGVLREASPSQSVWRLAGPASEAPAAGSSAQDAPGQGPEGSMPMTAMRRFLEQHDALGERGRQLLAAYPERRAWTTLADWLREVGANSYMSVEHHREVWTRTPDWDRRMSALVTSIDALWSDLGWLLPFVRPEGRHADVEALRDDYAQSEGRFLRKKQAIEQVLSRLEQLVEPVEAHRIRQDPRYFLNSLRWAQEQTAALGSEAADLLPYDVTWDAWNPSDRSVPRRVLQLSGTIGAARSLLSDEDLEFFARGGQTVDVIAYTEAWQGLLRALGATAKSVARWQGGDDLGVAVDRSAPAWRQQAERDHEGDLNRFRRADEALEDMTKLGFSDLVEELRQGRAPAADLPARLKLAIAREQLRTRLDDTELAAFDPKDRARRVEEYLATSSRVRESMRQELPARLLRERGLIPSRATSAQTRLRQEMERKKGGSIRRIFEIAGSTVLDITPCMLMSPSSVAKHLPVGSIEFDLVIFDEASQIRVADAIGSIGRAKSVVIVGDSQQMPPSSMFASTTDDDESEDDSGMVAADQESILSEAVAANVTSRMLSWHYRSQDESLIAFSNDRYYQGSLSTFPAPPISREGYGIRLIRAGGVFDGSTSDKSRTPTRTNEVEARLIVRDVVERLQKDPTASIGVVTFNIQQQNLIQDMLEDEQTGAVRQALAREVDPLIVKNLENVQGDERDVILFSLAFSPNPETGRMRLQFGPLSAQGGQRRLNVAITRARREVVLYTSFEPEDIDLSRTSSEGMSHLREYLIFAREQTELDGIPDRRPRAELHRQDVAQALRDAGLEVVEEYGMSKFQVDLAVRLPNSETWFALMLDGPSWAARQIVSDRDAVPSQILTKMGWAQVLQIWLPSWWSDRDAALTAVMGQIERATREAVDVNVQVATRAVIEDRAQEEPAKTPAAVHAEAPESTTRATTITDESSEVSTDSVVRPADRPSLVRSVAPAAAATIPEAWSVETVGMVPFVRASIAQIGQIDVLDEIAKQENRSLVRANLEEIIGTEGPIEEQRLARILALRFGLSKVQIRRREAILQCLGPVKRTYSRHETFYWSEQSDPIRWSLVRTPAGDRDTPEISPDEFQNALILVLRRQASAISEEQVFQLVKDLFGIRRLGARIRQAQTEALGALQARQIVAVEEGLVRLIV